jgi:uncharacterized membrane protein YdjX (TVP38/TMEM64 family)
MTRIVLASACVIAVAAAAVYLPLAEWVIALAGRARDAGPLGIALFVLAYIASTVLALPGSVLTLAAGFAYGPVWGLAVASPASVAGATAAFVLGRTLLRDWASRLVASSSHARALDAAVAREGFKLVLLVRLSPLFPFNILNYVLSLSNVSTRDYVAASAIGMLPGTALYVYLGSLAVTAAELTTAGARGGSVSAVVYGAGLLATIAVVIIATRAARRALQRELQEAG